MNLDTNAPEILDEISAEMATKISIIITLYNRANVVQKALNSVLAQTVPAYEIIIIDDGSTDNAKELLKPLIKDNASIIYYYQANAGAAAAKNKGATLATGDFITFLDSDDEFADMELLAKISDKITQQKSNNTIAKNQQIDFIGFTAMSVRKIDQNIIEYFPDDINVQLDKYMFQSPLHYPGKPPYFFSRQLFLKVGGFDTSFKWGEAMGFWRRFIPSCQQAILLDDIGYIYDQSDSNSVSRNRGNKYYFTAYSVINAVYQENKCQLQALGYSKNWQLILLIFAIFSKQPKLIINELWRFLTSNISDIPAALLMLYRAKVSKNKSNKTVNKTTK